MTNFFASQLSDRLHSTVSVEKVDISLFDKIILEGVRVDDQKNLEMIRVKKMVATINSFDLDSNVFHLDELLLEEAIFYLRYDTLGVLNLSFLKNLFKSKNKKSKEWSLTVNDLNVKNSKFKYIDENHLLEKKEGVDFHDISLSDVNFLASDIKYEKRIVNFVLSDLSFIEKSGFSVGDLDAIVFVNENTINISNCILKTANSKIRAYYLDFSFDSYRNFRHFVDEVNINAKFEDAQLEMNDIVYFAPMIKGFDNRFRFSGEFSGTVNDFKAKSMRVWFADSSYFEGRVEMTGLPKVNQTYVYAEIDQLYTSVSEIEKIKFRPFVKNDKLDIPSELKTLGQLRYKGNLSGYFRDFVAYGQLKTGSGSMSTDISIKAENGRTVFRGKISSKNLDLSKIAGSNQVGIINGTSVVNGYVDANKKFETKIAGNFQTIQIHKYNYHSIAVDAIINNGGFDGKCEVFDDNIKLYFEGKVDLTEKLPIFNFKASVDGAKLGKLNIVDDSLTTLSFSMNSNITGIDPDNLNGSFYVENLEFSNSNGLFTQPGVYIKLEEHDAFKDVSLKSDAIEVSLKGNFLFKEIEHNVNDFLKQYMPSFLSFIDHSPDLKAQHNDEIIFSVNLKDVSDLITVFKPELSISRNTLINGTYKSSTNNLYLGLSSSELSYSGYNLKNILLYGETKGGYLQFESQFDLPAEQRLFKNIKSSAIFRGDSVDFNIGWFLKDSLEYKGDIHAVFSFIRDSVGVDVKSYLTPGQFIVADSVWQYSKASLFYDSSRVKITNFSVFKNHEGIFIDGVVSKNESDTLNVIVKEFNIANLNEFIGSKKISLSGNLNSKIHILSLLNHPKVISESEVNNLMINNEKIGELSSITSWNSERAAIEIDAQIQKGRTKIVDLSGDLLLETKTLSLDAKLDNLYLKAYQKYMEGIMSDVKGYASGDLIINGTFKKPLIFGDLEIKSGGFLIDYLNTPYQISGNAVFRGQKVEFNKIPVFDKNLNVANLNGYIDYSLFPDFSYEFTIDMKNILALNTGRKDNADFYGTVNASGIVAFGGDKFNTYYSASAKTTGKTIFNIPITENSDIIRESFLKFKSENDKSRIKIIEEDEKITHLTNLDLNIEVTPDALIQIIFDETSGDVLKARGSGDFNIQSNPEDKLKIFGEYEIDDGEYLFTLQSIVNKKFDIEPGGTILWSGDPYKAQVDLNAVYRTKSSLYNLMKYIGDTNEIYKQRVPVECVIHMKNQLLNPEIELSVNIPTSQDAMSVLSNFTDDEISMQFMFLMVFNTFYYDPNSTASVENSSNSSNSNAINVTTMELLSNQVSNWLSKINSDLNIGVNYRPGDEIQTDEVEVALSTQFLHDRVTVSVNGVTELGSTDETVNSSNSQFLGDVNVEVKLTKKGNLRLKGFSRSNNDPLEKDNTSTQGVGIFYTKEFNRFIDIFKINRKKTSSDTITDTIVNKKVKVD